MACLHDGMLAWWHPCIMASLHNDMLAWWHSCMMTCLYDVMLAWWHACIMTCVHDDILAFYDDLYEWQTALTKLENAKKSKWGPTDRQTDRPTEWLIGRVVRYKNNFFHENDQVSPKLYIRILGWILSKMIYITIGTIFLPLIHIS